ncbi:MAG: hypothetical protein ACI9S8_000588 [Chlamydiales bacterium]|jgi:hypothetical protein
MSIVDRNHFPISEAAPPLFERPHRNSPTIKLIYNTNTLALKTLAIVSASFATLLAYSSSALASYTICSLAIASISITILCLSILRFQNSSISEIISNSSESQLVRTHRAIFDRNAALLHPDSRTSSFSFEDQDFRLPSAFIRDLERVPYVKINDIQYPSDAELVEKRELKNLIAEKEERLSTLLKSLSRKNVRKGKIFNLKKRIDKIRRSIRDLEIEETFMNKTMPSDLYKSVKSTPKLFETLSHVMQQASLEPFCGIPLFDSKNRFNKGSFIIHNFLKSHPQALTGIDAELSPEFLDTRNLNSPIWELNTTGDTIASARTRMGLINMENPEKKVKLELETEATYNLTKNTADFRVWLPRSSDDENY